MVTLPQQNEGLTRVPQFSGFQRLRNKSDQRGIWKKVWLKKGKNQREQDKAKEIEKNGYGTNFLEQGAEGGLKKIRGGPKRSHAGSARRTGGLARKRRTMEKRGVASPSKKP